MPQAEGRPVARDFPDGTVVQFNATRGSVSPMRDETESGVAMTTFTSNARNRNATVRALLDAETVSERIRVNAPR